MGDAIDVAEQHIAVADGFGWQVHDESPMVVRRPRPAHSRFVVGLFHPSPPPGHPIRILPWVTGWGRGMEQAANRLLRELAGDHIK
ncbi:MAG: hypothetical protein DHS20C03_29220 [Minwuia thermotolerans]|nr:MAG: hypothetical protein DHS20C03_29220 [Minwuia thermotolerans]